MNQRVQLPQIAVQVINQRLTYLSPLKMRSLIDRLADVDANGVEGGVMELGVALGGSAIVLASLCVTRAFKGYDVFGMIPPPSDKDEQDTHDRYDVIKSGQSKGIGPDEYYGYVNDLRSKVEASFTKFGLHVDGQKIALVEGLFEDTLVLSKDERVALAHIDCDWFEPVLLCLTRLAPHISRGGIIILDDYNDYTGCRKATDQFLVSHSEFALETTKPHAVITRL